MLFLLQIAVSAPRRAGVRDICVPARPKRPQPQRSKAAESWIFPARGEEPTHAELAPRRIRVQGKNRGRPTAG
jgi:hypothetical protein